MFLMRKLVQSEKHYRDNCDRNITSSSEIHAVRKNWPASIYLRYRYLMMQRAINLGYWMPDGLMALMCLALKRGDTFLDIGANVGWITEKAAWLVGDKGRVYSFEPSPTTRCFLERRAICMGLKNVEICPFALGDSESIATLHEFAENYGGASSLAFGSRTAPGQHLIAETPVPVHTLDSWVQAGGIYIGHIQLIKIDVQGAEIAVLSGGIEVFSAIHPPVLYIEVQESAQAAWGYRPIDLIKTISDLGYLMYSWREDGLVAVQSESDLPVVKDGAGLDDLNDNLICLKSDYAPHAELYRKLLVLTQGRSLWRKIRSSWGDRS